MGVLVTRALLFRVDIRAPDCWKLSYEVIDILPTPSMSGSKAAGRL